MRWKIGTLHIVKKPPYLTSNLTGYYQLCSNQQPGRGARSDLFSMSALKLGDKGPPMSRTFNSTAHFNSPALLSLALFSTPRPLPVPCGLLSNLFSLVYGSWFTCVRSSCRFNLKKCFCFPVNRGHLQRWLGSQQENREGHVPVWRGRQHHARHMGERHDYGGNVDLQGVLCVQL